MINNQFNIDNILIPLSKKLYIKYSNIISILSPDEVDNQTFYSYKKKINEPEDKQLIRSYIYCKNDFLIATTINVVTLKKRIDNILDSYYENNIFR